MAATGARVPTTTSFLTVYLLLNCLLTEISGYALRRETDNLVVTLSHVREDALKTVSPNVEQLLIEHSHFPVIRTNLFARFTKLFKLRLFDCSVSIVERDAFVGLTKLRDLDLSHNQLSHLEARVFSSQGNLTRLNLSGNKFDSIPYVNDNLADTLAVLDVSGNRIRHAGTRAVTIFRELRELNLESNNLDHDSLKQLLTSFENSTSLRVLRAGNPVTGDEERRNKYYKLTGTFPSMPSLEYLDLSLCELYDIVENTIKDRLDNLQTLILSHNSFRRVPHELYGSGVANLDMSYNARSTNDFNISQSEYSWPRIETLNISRNQITILTKGMFKNFPGLKLLNVSYNDIREMRPNTFEGLRELKTLDLSNNGMEEIVNFTFANLTQLETLILDRNNLKVYPRNHPFLELYQLKRLSFRYNSLCEIWWWLLQDQVNLEYLDARDNKIESWKTRAFEHTKNIRRVLLSKNEITKVSQFMLVDTATIEWIDISDNPFNCSDCDLVQTQKWVTNRSAESEWKNFACFNLPGNGQVTYLLNATLSNKCQEVTAQLPRQSLAIPLSLTTVVFVIISLTVAFTAYKLRWYTKYYYYVWCLRAGLRRNVTKTSYNGRSGYLYDAYLSYSKKDSEWLSETFLNALESGGPNAKVYFRDRDSELGKHVIDTILDGMENSRYFVAVISENYLKSSWRLWELKLAVCRALNERTPNVIILNLNGATETAKCKSVKRAIATQIHLQWSNDPLKQKVVIEKITHKLTHLHASQTK